MAFFDLFFCRRLLKNTVCLYLRMFRHNVAEIRRHPTENTISYETPDLSRNGLSNAGDLRALAPFTTRRAMTLAPVMHGAHTPHLLQGEQPSSHHPKCKASETPALAMRVASFSAPAPAKEKVWQCGQPPSTCLVHHRASDDTCSCGARDRISQGLQGEQPSSHPPAWQGERNTCSCNARGEFLSTCSCKHCELALPAIPEHLPSAPQGEG